MNITFEQTWEEDVPQLVAVQNRSFASDLTKYGVCPGHGHAPEVLQRRIRSREAHVYTIRADGEIIGDIIVREEAPGEFTLGCLCVLPEWEGKGIGRRAIAFLEGAFADASRWRLSTPADKARNIRFYERNGFTVSGRSVDQGVEIVTMERRMDAPAQ